MAEHGRSNTEQDDEARAMKQFVQKIVLSRKIEAQFIKALPPFWQHSPDYSNLAIFHQLIKLCTLTHSTEPKKQATSIMYSLAIFAFMSHRTLLLKRQFTVKNQAKRNWERKVAPSWMWVAICFQNGGIPLKFCKPILGLFTCKSSMRHVQGQR